jgi:rod shape-determining protein MreC
MNSSKSKLIKFFIALIFCLVLVFFNPRNIFSPLRGSLLFVAYPFQKVSYVAGKKIGQIWDFLISISELKKENRNLIAENDSLSARVADFSQIKKENEILREQLKLLPADKFDLEPAYVIGQDAQQDQGGWIMIDKGASVGLKKGMTAIVSDGILVGRVEDVFEKSSRINLVTNPNSSINVSDSETGAKGIVKGEFGLGVVMDMISQTDVLNEGDDIVSSGLGGNTPKGLLVGKIQSFTSTEDKLFQRAIVFPRVRYQDLEIVFVIKNYL